MLLHWMQTRWMTGLITAPGCGDLGGPPVGEAADFSGVLSVDMSGILTRRGMGSKGAGGIHNMWQAHPFIGDC